MLTGRKVKKNINQKIIEITKSTDVKPPDSSSVRRKGIYFLPNLLTTGALFAGFYSILLSFGGQYESAVIALFVAMLFDGLDGRVARLTNTQSDFGVQYDSLSDMVSFGVAPAIVSYGWGVDALGQIGFACVFLYASCAALRLARFNVAVSNSSSSDFTGLPSPVAAALIAGFIWSTSALTSSLWLPLFGALITGLSGLLMVSNFRYPSFKDFDMKGRVPFFNIFLMVVTLIIITIDPANVLFLMALTYSAIGPARILIKLAFN